MPTWLLVDIGVAAFLMTLIQIWLLYNISVDDVRSWWRRRRDA